MDTEINKLTNEKRQIIAGYFFSIGATAIWSGNFIIARGLSESIPPISLAFWRWTVAVIVFLPFALKPLIVEWSILKENIPYLSITSLLGITIFNTLIYFAGHTTTAINLSLIAITFPIFVIILSRIFFHELLTINKGLGIILVVTGIVMLITKGNLSKLLNISFAIGDVWMLIATIIFAIYNILLKRKPEKLSILAFQLATFILGLIFLFPFFIWEYITAPPIKFNTMNSLSILCLGVFVSISAFIL
ncbi:DMT family transporter [Candidatus Scalindua japonica]|uniref:DMT family transporter n=1 Tax=Candidatus Scalindua japonica TaxID=1284222 RepID=UPI00193D205E|nr:EamA family transporter [Candidatus Scalindua japonica]